MAAHRAEVHVLELGARRLEPGRRALLAVRTHDGAPLPLTAAGGGLMRLRLPDSGVYDVEVEFGAGKGQRGLTMMLTFGTGIGSALLVDGILVPNTELGHLELDGHDAETRAATATYYVRYTQYAKYPDGTVRRVGGGTVGPYYTRRSAQSTCDWYNANDYYVGRVRYYYSARVI